MSDIIKSNKEQAYELDGRIKTYANMAWCNLMESAKCLKKMRDSKLYIEIGYKSFDEYTVGSLGIHERQAYTYIKPYEELGERFLKENASMGITKLALIAQVSPLDREEVINNNDIAGMTVDQVRQLVKEHDLTREQLTLLTEQKEALVKQLSEEKNKPTEIIVEPPSEEQIAKIQNEASEKSAKDAEQKIRKVTKELEQKFEDALEEAKSVAKKEKEAAIEEYKRKLSDIDEAKAEALQKANRLEKQLEVASSAESVKFQFYFEALQSDFLRITESLEKLAKENCEISEKFRRAILKYVDMMKLEVEKGQ